MSNIEMISILRRHPCLVRAARGLLAMSQDDLSCKAGVPHRTLVRFEIGEGVPRDATVGRILDALHQSGIVFFLDSSGALGVGFRPAAMAA